MRKIYLNFLVALAFCISVAGAQNLQTIRLKGKVLDSTGLPMASADVKVFQDTRLITEGKSNTVGDFDLEVAPGEYRLEVSAPDFDLSRQTVRANADMPPLAVTLSVKPVDTIVEVKDGQNDLGVDPLSSLNTDVITGDGLLD